MFHLPSKRTQKILLKNKKINKKRNSQFLQYKTIKKYILLNNECSLQHNLLMKGELKH